MTIASAVAARLLSLAPVTALVGSRVRVLKLAQGEAHAGAIRVQRISEIQAMQLRGAVNTFEARVQVDSYASETAGDAYAAAASIDAAVHGDGAGGGLCGFAGVAGGMRIDAILPVDVRETYDADDLRVVRVMREYMVRWRE